MTVIPFSQALRERTWGSHGDSEGADFMKDLMEGRGTREDYIALVVQHYFLYEALEQAASQFEDDAVARPFISPQLTRLSAIEADLAFLLGDGWRGQISPLPTTDRYVRRIREIALEGWSGGIIAHHYTRYLGDLSGGQFLGPAIARSYGLNGDGHRFFVFPGVRPPAFRTRYRELLDEISWPGAEEKLFLSEVSEAYRLNIAVLADLKERWA